MRNPSLLLLIVVFILAPFKLSAAADTVAVRETRIPVLIERQDNELFHLRIEAAQSQMLNEVKLDFGKDVNLNEIESVKLYYGGTESVERRGKTYFAPVDYISNNTPGKTLAANTSYSVLKSEVKAPKYNPQIQISAESETKRSIFRKRDKTKRSKKESAQHSKSRNKSFVMTSVSAL